MNKASNAQTQRFCGILEYDGTDFEGYQLQPNKRTVQGELEKSLEKLLNCTTRVQAAGRTDSGVHSKGQVIAFDGFWKSSVKSMEIAINRLLPKDIALKSLCVAPNFFSPRFNAIGRTYEYTIINKRQPDVVQRRYSWYVDHYIDINLLNKASEILMGYHNFSQLGKSTSPNGSLTRLVTKAEWVRMGDKLLFTISANAFLYRMVRKIVSTVVKVSQKKITFGEFENVLIENSMFRQVAVAPPQGLCLVNVRYPDYFKSWMEGKL